MDTASYPTKEIAGEFLHIFSGTLGSGFANLAKLAVHELWPAVYADSDAEGRALAGRSPRS